MKKLFLFCLLGFLGLAVLGSYAPIYAYPTAAPSLSVGDIITFEYGPGNTGGGEFDVYDASGNNYIYTSFCLETNEYLNDTAQFEIYDISTEARNGGSGGGVGSADPISPETAYLFSHFFWGDLTDYTYGSDASADLLQKAIWWLEGETLGEYNNYVKLAEDAVNPANPNRWSGLGDVRVLNLFWANTGIRAQDQLVVIPVPESDTLLLLGFGLISLVGIGRTRFRLRGKRD